MIPHCGELWTGSVPGYTEKPEATVSQMLSMFIIPPGLAKSLKRSLKPRQILHPVLQVAVGSLHTLATHLHSFEPEIVHSSLSWFSAQPLCNLAYLSLPLRPFLTRLHWSAGRSNTESHVSLRSCVRHLKTWLSDVHLLPIVSDLLSLLSSFLRLFLVHITLGHETWNRLLSLVFFIGSTKENDGNTLCVSVTDF